jgi:hypothetical protein
LSPRLPAQAAGRGHGIITLTYVSGPDVRSIRVGQRTSGPEAVDADQKRLHELGYARNCGGACPGSQLRRPLHHHLDPVGYLTLYGFGMLTGGPAEIIWGWLFVGVMTLFVGLSMAEVCSSYRPRAAVYWAAKWLGTGSRGRRSRARRGTAAIERTEQRRADEGTPAQCSMPTRAAAGAACYR